MKIQKIKIDAFGKLADKQLEFSDGINIIRGSNESGKSTLSGFLKYILFGTASGKNLDGYREKELYSPWNGNAISGAAQIACDDAIYSVTRSHGQRASLKVYCNGEEYNPGKQLGEQLLGVDEEAFSKMAYISQSNVSANNMEGMNQILRNIVYAADESINIEKAQKKLSDFRNVFRSTRNTGKCVELEEKIRNLKYIHDENAQKHKQLLEAQARLDETKSKIASNTKKLDELKNELFDIEAFGAKELLDRITAAKAEVDMSEASLLAARAALTYGGTLCNAEQITLLEQKLSRYEHCLFEHENSNRIFDEAVERMAQAERDDDILKRCNGKTDEQLSSMVGDCAKYSSKKGYFAISGFCFSAFAVALAALSLTGLCERLGIGPTVALLSGIALLGVALVCVAFFSVYSSRLKALFKEYGVKNQKELLHFAQTIPTTRRQHIELSTKIKVLGDEIKVKKTSLSNAEGELLQALAPFGVGIDHAAALIKELKQRYSQLEACANEYKQLCSNYDVLTQGISLAELESLAKEYSGNELRDKKTVMRECEYHEKANKALEELEKEYIQRVAVPASTIRKPSEILSEITSLEAELSDCSSKAAAANLALEALKLACDDLKSGIAPLIEKRASELFSQFTDGKYQGIGLDSGNNLFATENGIHRDGSFLSKGTRDAAYFALRIALCEVLFKEKPVLIFDEVFAFFDNERLKAALDCVCELSKNYQIFIFTCHDRESSIIGSRASNLIEL